MTEQENSRYVSAYWTSVIRQKGLEQLEQAHIAAALTEVMRPRSYPTLSEQIQQDLEKASQLHAMLGAIASGPVMCW